MPVRPRPCSCAEPARCTTSSRPPRTRAGAPRRPTWSSTRRCAPPATPACRCSTWAEGCVTAMRCTRSSARSGPAGGRTTSAPPCTTRRRTSGCPTPPARPRTSRSSRRTGGRRRPPRDRDPILDRVTLLLQIAFWASLAALVWTHLAYPLVVAVWARLHPWPVAKADVLPTVSLIIPAYNEEQVIVSKLENALELDYPRELLE